jgi:hypothetical protein
MGVTNNGVPQLQYCRTLFLCAQPRMEISCLTAARAWHSEQVKISPARLQKSKTTGRNNT